MLTPEQVNEVFQNLLNVDARDADIRVVEILGGTEEVLAEYIWDHWLGEPDGPTCDAVEQEIVRVLADFEKERSS